jgi:hypothetical protein
MNTEQARLTHRSMGDHMNTEHARMTHGVALRVAAGGFAALLLPGLAAAAGGADDKGWFAQVGAGA